MQIINSIIKSKLNKVKFTRNTEVLRSDIVRDYLNDFKQKFVICPIDKAAHNFAIVCKHFYLQTIKNELGVSNEAIGNEVYKPVDMHPDELINMHTKRLLRYFNI